MPISFKISKKGKKVKAPTRDVEPKPIEVIELSDGSFKDRFEISEDSNISSYHRFGDLDFNEYNGKDDNVADLVGSSNTFEREPEVSFILNLYADGYSVLAPENDNEKRAIGQDKLNLWRPYDRASEDFFNSIESGTVPTVIPDDIPCKFRDGAMSCEVRDHRKCISDRGSNIPSSHESPTISKVQLKLTLHNVVVDMASMIDNTWKYEDLLNVESRIVNPLTSKLDLDPSDRFRWLREDYINPGINLDIPKPRKRRLVNRASSSGHCNVMPQDLQPIPENAVVHIPENAFAQGCPNQRTMDWEPDPIFPQGAPQRGVDVPISYTDTMHYKRARTEPRNYYDSIQPQPGGSSVNRFQYPEPEARTSTGSQYGSMSSDAPFGQVQRGKTALSGGIGSPRRVETMDDLMATSTPSISTPQPTGNSILDRFSKIGTVAKRSQQDCGKNKVGDEFPQRPRSFSAQGLRGCLTEAREENIIEEVIHPRSPSSPQVPPVETETFDSSQGLMNELLSKHLPRTRVERPENLKSLLKPEGDMPKAMSPRQQQMDSTLRIGDESPLGNQPSITQQVPPQPQYQVHNQQPITEQVPPLPQSPLQTQPSSMRHLSPQQQSRLHNQPSSMHHVPPQQQSPLHNHPSNVQQLPIRQQFAPLQNQQSIGRQTPTHYQRSPLAPRNNSMPQLNAFVPHQHTQAFQMQRGMMVSPETGMNISNTGNNTRFGGLNNVTGVGMANMGQDMKNLNQSNATSQNIRARTSSPQMFGVVPRKNMMVGNQLGFAARPVAAQEMHPRFSGQSLNQGNIGRTQWGAMPRMNAPLNQQQFQQQQQNRQAVMSPQHARWPSTQGNPQQMNQQFAAQQQARPQLMGQWTQPVQSMRAANPEGHPVSTTGSSHTPSSSQV